jgi:uncharacterized membrane-anchored protein
MRTKYIIIVALQALLLVGMIGMREVWIAKGEKIRLKTVPVDPRDIFRGDYARLRYDISSLNLSNMNCPNTFNKNDKVYVTLKKGEKDYYEAASVSSKRPPGGMFIMGKASYPSRTESKWEVKLKDETGAVQSFHVPWFYDMKKGDLAIVCLDKQDNVVNFFKENAQYPQKCYSEKTVRGSVEEVIETRYQIVDVEYGIESYFVEEGSGRVIEAAPRSKDVIVEVSLNKKGQGLITGLFIDGKKF